MAKASSLEIQPKKNQRGQRKPAWKTIERIYWALFWSYSEDSNN